MVEDSGSLYFISTFLFVVQIIFKQIYISRNFQTVILINILVVVLSMFLSKIFVFDLIDTYFFVESLLSLLLLVFSELVNVELTLDYLVIGTLFWMLGDIVFLDSNILNIHFSGDRADFFYFIGLVIYFYSFNNLGHNFLLIKEKYSLK